MKKNIIFIISFIFILLVGCGENEDRILKKANKTMDEIDNYESLLDIRIDTEDNKASYKMKETYKDKGPLVEVMYPEENNGITLEYQDDKIIIENSSIEQSITLERIKNLDKGFLLKDIIDNIGDFTYIKEETIDGDKYYVFKYIFKNPNKYNHEKILLLDKKNLSHIV